MAHPYDYPDYAGAQSGYDSGAFGYPGYPQPGGHPGMHPGVGMPARSFAAMPATEMPPKHTGYAVLTMIFCFWPLSLVALIRGSDIETRWAAGDYAGAQRASDEARKFCRWSLIVGIVGWVFLLLYVVFVVAMMVGVATSTPV